MAPLLMEYPQLLRNSNAENASSSRILKALRRLLAQRLKPGLLDALQARAKIAEPGEEQQALMRLLALGEGPVMLRHLATSLAIPQLRRALVEPDVYVELLIDRVFDHSYRPVQTRADAR